MFEIYKNRMNRIGATPGEARYRINQQIMDHCFNDTTGYKRVKINDKFYDARLIVGRQKTVESHFGNLCIQFKHDMVFPVGTYIDIPKRNGEYTKWLLVTDKDDMQFPKNCIIECNYNLRWMHNYKMIEYPVALRTKNSYTDGVHQAEEFNTLDNQAAFWLPFNEDSMEITYNMRFLISNNPKHPQAYTVTKVNDTLRKGLVEVILLQDQVSNFDNGELMCADYYKDLWHCTMDILNVDGSLNMKVSDKFKLDVRGSIEDRPADITDIIFESSDSSIASVNKVGMIRSHKIGDCRIKVSLGNITKEIPVSVGAVTNKIDSLTIIDPDGDNILRLHFTKTLQVVFYQFGIEAPIPVFDCEIIDGADFASIEQVEDTIIVSTTPSLNNIGRNITIKAYNDDLGIEDQISIIVKGTI